MNEQQPTPRQPIKDLGRGLCLTRREGQYVIINDGQLLIQLVQIRGKQIRLKFIGDAKIERAEKFETAETEDD